MFGKKLRVRARGAALCSHHASSGRHDGVRRFVGRVFDANLGVAGGWPASKEAEVLECNQEQFADYRQAVRDGDLWAADEDTAKLCDVKFDPKFGGDFDEPKSAPKADKAKDQG